MTQPPPEPQPQVPPQAPPQQGPADPPPYAAPAPPPYAAGGVDQRALWEKKGMRGLIVGALWFVAGLLITLYTYGQASSSGFGGVYIVAWGPMAYGAFRLVYGGYLISKAKR
ncbi:MAG TPA: hypothetical protein VGL93_22060 [Streptosporangiaceae bacterium]